MKPCHVSQGKTAFCTTLFILIGVAARGAEMREAVFVSPTEERRALSLASVNESLTITFADDDGSRTVSRGELVHWGARTSLPQSGQALLTDGSLIAADLWKFDGERATFSSGLFGEVKLSRQNIKGAIFVPPPSTLEHDRLLAQLNDVSLREDRVALENGDSLSATLGVLSKVETPDAAASFDVMEKYRWQLFRDGAEVFVPLEKIVSLALAQPPSVGSDDDSPAILWGLRDGSLLAVQSLQEEDGLVTLSLVSGAQLTSDAASLWDETTLLRPLNAGVTYLSDIEALGHKHIPFLTRAWEHGVDRNVLGGLLRCDGVVVSKGLGMHSRSRLAYALPADARRFEAELAIDAAAGRAGSVVFRVLLYSKDGGWSLAYSSDVIRGGDSPTPASVDLNGASAMALVVEYADRADVKDYANWLSARLLK